MSSGPESEFPGMAQLLHQPAPPPREEHEDFPAISGGNRASAEQRTLVRIIGERMRSARELCNLSQTEAARMLGYSNSSKLAKIERAKDTNSVPIWVLPRAAKIYGVTVGYLMGTEEADVSQAAAVVRASNIWLADALQKARERDLAAIASVRDVAEVGAHQAALLIGAALDTHDAFERFMERNSSFSTAPSSATLFHRAEVLSSLAKKARAALHRAGCWPSQPTTERN